MSRHFLSGARNRVLQVLALYSPGGDTLRVALHRRRGVKIGRGTWIGFDTLIEPSYPHRVMIGDRVAIGIRVLILAHFAHQGRNRETTAGALDDRVSVRIEDDVFIGPGALIMPNVTIGRGAVDDGPGKPGAADRPLRSPARSRHPDQGVLPPADADRARPRLTAWPIT